MAPAILRPRSAASAAAIHAVVAVSATALAAHDYDSKLSEDRVIATRAGRDRLVPQRREFVIDFRGPKLDEVGPGGIPEAVATCSDNATIGEVLVLRNAPARGWRVVIKVGPKELPDRPIDPRCALKRGADWVSETWAYRWIPR